jgi:hypothetical protein
VSDETITKERNFGDDTAVNYEGLTLRADVDTIEGCPVRTMTLSIAWHWVKEIVGLHCAGLISRVRADAFACQREL